eukprot:scaffold5079_cov169-Amphora_coffeaeformis.AAC.6
MTSRSSAKCRKWKKPMYRPKKENTDDEVSLFVLTAYEKGIKLETRQAQRVACRNPRWIERCAGALLLFCCRKHRVVKFIPMSE